MLNFDFSQPQQWVNGWSKMVEQQLGHCQSACERAEKLQAQMVERAIEAIDEGAKLARTSVSYCAELGREWRKQCMEAAKRGADMASPAAHGA
ncbi:MAG: hypothetical protein HY744_32180 [Deltaproteobacteria bacterium]|nr:hypothetical protein [Deltaproteobacteria bacterium]